MKEYLIKHTIDFKKVEEELGIRKAQTFAKGGIQPFVVVFQDMEKYKSNRQNRLFHALLNIFFKSGCFSHNIGTVDELKDYYKYHVGMIDYYHYFNGKTIVRAKTEKEIPTHIHRQNACRIVLKSWAKASKKEAKNAIELLIAEMLQSGVGSTSYGKKFDEILTELEKNEQ
jgi:hypothetical protein